MDRRAFNKLASQATLSALTQIAGSAAEPLVSRENETNAAIQHVERMPNTANPELLYWFISPSEIKDQAYARDLDLTAANGTFNFIFLTQREGADFYDYATMHPIFKDLVALARTKGIKVGLQL